MSYITDVTCPVCEGSGYGKEFFNSATLDVDMDACENCLGTGRLIDWEEYDYQMDKLSRG